MTFKIFLDKTVRVFDRIWDSIFPPEKYVSDVKNAHWMGKTFKPELYSKESLPREMFDKDLTGVYYPNYNARRVELKKQLRALKRRIH